MQKLTWSVGFFYEPKIIDFYSVRIAIMQPYFFPYVGYYQLARSVDKFVFYDDVSFIKQGWINRNTILLNGTSHLFSIPVSSISSFEMINQTSVSYSPDWTSKFLKKIESAYRKSPYYASVYPLIAEIVNAKPEQISDLAKMSIQGVFDYLDIPFDSIFSSSKYGNSSLKSQERIIDICLKEKASTYHNPIGGVQLYDRNAFIESELELFFVKPSLTAYKQNDNDFVPGLSMIDVLMFNSRDEIVRMLGNYELV